jgi:putative redox protein
MFHRVENGATVICIKRRIEIQNTPDAEVWQRLIRVAENCPISKILEGNIKIITDFLPYDPSK